jgi:tRNA G46 methylase TrmB
MLLRNLGPEIWPCSDIFSGFLPFANSGEQSTLIRLYSGYPPEAVDKLLEHVGVKNQKNAHIVEIGSGTGKFTDLLVARPENFDVVAIEPHEGMRGALVKKNLAIKVLDGNAGNMPVQDGWGDALIAAQVSSIP